MASESRFQLYVKAGEDGVCVGDCPFSQRAAMYARLTLKPEDVELVTVNTVNKPESFLKLNPEGKVPVLVDRQKGGNVVPDSAEIVKYLSEISPNPDLQTGYSGPGSEVSAGIFPKFAAMMRNQDPSKDAEFRDALTTELSKLNTFLEQQKGSGDQYMLCGVLCELDCQVLPKLRHIQVAGSHYMNYNIPAEFKALTDYIKCGENNPVFNSTRPQDKEIIWGWSKVRSV